MNELPVLTIRRGPFAIAVGRAAARVAVAVLITIENAIGTHVFQVVEIRTVAPTDLSVAGQWRGAWLTLTTCTPVFTARERLVVISRLVESPNASVILNGS